jgi:drug/metabolite transporter superfamily protein YnfA
MTGTDTAHSSHDAHPISATIVLLLFVALFSALFAKMASVSFDVSIAIVAGLFAVFGLLWIWVLDRD